MSIELRTFSRDDVDTLLALTCDPALADEFELLQTREGWDGPFTDPFNPPELRWIALVDGEPAALSFSFVLPSWRGDWAMVRIGVAEKHRRRGLGSRLIEASRAGIRAAAPECRELCISAWLPAPTVPGFSARHGFEHARYFWLMERPRHDLSKVTWPDGITTRTFDGSDQSLSDWNDVYNASFAEHYHGVIGTIAICRALTLRPDFHPDGLMLAYRDGRCVGFCLNELHPHRGEIGTLGVAPEARGLGLGRALLRWGLAWLDRAGAPRLTLVVDGENETALGLYRSERFEVARTRQIWSQPLP